MPYSYAVFPKETMEKMAQSGTDEEKETQFQAEHHPYRTLLFSVHSLKNPTLLLLKLQRHSDAVSSFIFYKLSDKTQVQVNEFNDQLPPKPKLLKGVLNAINEIVLGPFFYTPELFAEVTLSQESKTLLTWYQDNVQKGTAKQEEITAQTIRLHRLLLEDTYPEELWALNRTVRSESLLALARPSENAVVSNTDQEQQRFLEIYEGKTFSYPPMAQEPKPVIEAPENKQESPENVDEEQGLAWGTIIPLGLIIIACFWLVRQWQSSH